MIPGNLLDRPIESLPFGQKGRGIRVKVLSALSVLRVMTVGDLIKISPEQLLGHPALGAKSLADVRQVLKTVGLSLRDDDGASYGVLFGRWVRAGRPSLYTAAHQRGRFEERELSRIRRECQRGSDGD